LRQDIWIARLFGEGGDTLICVHLEQAKTGSLAGFDRLHCHGDLGVVLPVSARQGGVIHGVQMIAGQDQYIRCAGSANLEKLLAHGVGGALIPVGAARRLLCRQDLHISVMEIVEVIGLGDVAMQGDRVELGENRDLVDARIDAVADGYVNQTIFAGDWHRGFGTLFGQRVKSPTHATAQDNRQDVL